MGGVPPNSTPTRGRSPREIHDAYPLHERTLPRYFLSWVPSNAPRVNRLRASHIARVDPQNRAPSITATTSPNTSVSTSTDFSKQHSTNPGRCHIFLTQGGRVGRKRGGRPRPKVRALIRRAKDSVALSPVGAAHFSWRVRAEATILRCRPYFLMGGALLGAARALEFASHPKFLRLVLGLLDWSTSFACGRV